MTRGWQSAARSTRDRRRKKQRQQRPTGEQPRPVARQASTGERPPATGGWRAAPAARPTTAQSIRPEDYQYVYSDLKRIAVLASAIFLVLIALTFVIK